MNPQRCGGRSVVVVVVGGGQGKRQASQTGLRRRVLACMCTHPASGSSAALLPSALPLPACLPARPSPRVLLTG